ncbi:MAG: glycerophosphodiester phosphodiesterase [Geminicoccaceae bacterium]
MRPDDTDNIDEQRRRLMRDLPVVIGHRGAALHAPENTLASMLKSLELGANWVEIDVKLARDGEPFLLHDADLDRTTDGSGPAAVLAMNELATLDAGSWFGAGFQGERLPTLVELVELIDRHDMGLNLEIKPSPGTDVETTEVIIETLRRCWPATRPWPLLSSFRRGALARAREIAPEIPRGLLLKKLEPDWRETMADLGCASLHLKHVEATPDLLAGTRAAGLPVLLYTVNDGATGAALLRKGARSIISDAPERILAALDASREP